jgi:hypothetical protein
VFDLQLSSDVLRESRVSPAEYFVMGTVAYGIFLPPEELARQSFKLSKDDPRGDAAEQEHLDALFGCIQKNWLEIVKSERQKGDDILKVGTVDFTPEGISLYREIIKKIFGEDFVSAYENLSSDCPGNDPF